MDRKCIGLVHAIGLASGIAAADAMVKGSDVKLLGYEYSGYGGRVVVKVEGNAGAVKAAVAIGRKATETVKGTLKGCEGAFAHFALDGTVYDTLIRNAQTIGDPLQVASGKRPQGTSRQAKWVGHWEQKGCYIRE